MNMTWNWTITRRTTRPYVPANYWFVATQSMIKTISSSSYHFRFVQFIMLLSAHYFQIVNSVILSVMIFVVNYFRQKKFSIKKFFHDVSMFKNVGIVNPNTKIPRANYPFMEILHSSNITFVSASNGTKFCPHSISPHDERIPTNETDFIDIPIFVNFFRESFSVFIFAFVGTKKTSTSSSFRFSTFTTMFTRYPHDYIISF